MDDREIKRVLGFSINVEAGDDLEIVIRVAAGSIEIEGYTDLFLDRCSKGKEPLT